MTETDSIVHKYLLTVSEKLAKQFAKKRPSPTPWAGPTLDIIIDFYKNSRKEETAPAQNGTENGIQPVTNGSTKKKGKKRKISEVNAPTTELPTTEPSAEPEKKKKKKKKKNKTPEVVEIIQDKSPAEETPVAAAPEEEAVPEPAPEVAAEASPEVQEGEANLDDSADDDNVAAPGGLVGIPSEDKPKKSKLQRKKSNSSFRRVKEEDVVIKKKALADNTFEAKQGADDYGYKANQILKFTKGKSFRHEKTKKKRGTYKGGAINMGVTSIKFDSDSD